MQLYKSYCKQLYREYGYRATWLPNVSLKLGDVGIIQGGVFYPWFNLEDRDISFQTESGNPADYKYKTARAVTISAKAAGQPIPKGSLLAKADAGVIVTFSKDTAILFHATDAVPSRIKDREKLGEIILSRYKDQNWKAEYLVITEVVTAASATVAVAGSSNGVLELKASGTIPVGGSLASATAGFKATPRTTLGFEVVADKGLTLLYKTGCLQAPWFPFSKVKFKLQGANPLILVTPQQVEDAKAYRHIKFDEWSPKNEEYDE